MLKRGGKCVARSNNLGTLDWLNHPDFVTGTGNSDRIIDRSKEDEIHLPSAFSSILLHAAKNGLRRLLSLYVTFSPASISCPFSPFWQAHWYFICVHPSPTFFPKSFDSLKALSLPDIYAIHNARRERERRSEERKYRLTSISISFSFPPRTFQPARR